MTNDHDLLLVELAEMKMRYLAMFIEKVRVDSALDKMRALAVERHEEIAALRQRVNKAERVTA